jgi:DNA-binding GntR family transcriptional regulator
MLREPKLTHLQKLLLDEVMTLAKRKGYSWCTNAHLSERFAAGESSVNRAINDLIQAGHLKSENGHHNKRHRTQVIPVA